MNTKNKLKINTPTIIVIFGVTGDLSQRKLLPAILDLELKKALPNIFRIVGFSRRDLSDKDFKSFIADAIKREKHKHDNKEIVKLTSKASYHQGTFADIKDYKRLAKTLEKIDGEIGQCTNKLFYLAVPPKFYETIFKNLAKSTLTKSCNTKSGWNRVLVEKPFGKDVKTAQKLDRLLDKLFKEEQIFRIDHYLAKETIQNILSFRFSNSIFEPIWNKKYIARIEIKLFEKLDVASRGVFYDGVGALSDVGQNHMLQILALMTMDNPQDIEAGLVRKERAKAMRSLKILSKKDVENSVIRGQYIGFKTAKGVSSNSQTETYFKIKAYIKNKRWQGVPFILESGKALSENKVEVKVFFKPITPCFCDISHKGHNHQNIITFKIQPQKEIQIRFWAKKSGLVMNIEPKDLSFSYGDKAKVQLDPYEKVLFDCMVGDQTLFTGSKEIEASWKFITSILNNWQKNKLYKYKKGNVPTASDF